MPPVSNETLLRYCQQVYDVIAKNTNKRKVNGKFVQLWEGKIVETYAGSGVSNAFYGKVMNTLYEIGCLQMLRRGARGSLTQIIVLRRPEPFDLERVHGLARDLTPPTEYATLALRVDQMERRFDGIDVAKMFSILEQRVRTLEAKLAGASK